MSLSIDGSSLRLHDDDNVAVCLRRVPSGNEIVFENGSRVTAVTEIPAGHKIALRPIARGEFVIKYGERMGRASTDIACGDHAHVHNIEGVRGRGDLAASAGNA
jgi:altronate dehydratase small subunit